MSDKGRSEYSWIQTFSGRQFWPLAPRIDDIDIRDIAHALSMLCRFNGHSHTFYSVAEHSIHVSSLVSQEHKLWGLLHDAAEAYLSDIPRPIKGEVAQFRLIEDELLTVISESFDLNFPVPSEVIGADALMLSTEKKLLMGEQPASWGILPTPTDAISIQCLSPHEAESNFLNLFEELQRH